MVTLSELARLAGQRYPAGGVPTLPKILITWAQLDPGEELTRILKGSGINNVQMALALEDFLTEVNREDSDLLGRCVRNTCSSPPLLGCHLLMTLCTSSSHRITRKLVGTGLDLEILRRRLEMELFAPPRRPAAEDGNRNPHGAFLRSLGRDLSDLAAKGHFEELCDRPEELDRMINVLMKRRKANVVLTGPAGVGKTALAELLARRIVQERVPPPLRHVRCFEVRVGSLLAGTRYRGEFEERMERLMHALRAVRPALVFIDEIHLIRGAGRGEGMVLDAANMLKAFLAGEDLRVIGATTPEEYRCNIGSDSALARRFQEIRVREPDTNLTLHMLLRQAHVLSEYHGIRIPDSVVREAVALSDDHILDRFHPDKDVDLLEGAAILAVRQGRDCMERKDLHRTLDRDAALLRVPPAELKTLSARLKARVVGQDHALRRVLSTLLLRLQGLSCSGKTLAAFLLAGSDGVGKETLARAIAAELYRSESKLLKIDLSEYVRPGEANRLAGVPPGFTGSHREGVVAKWLHERGPGVLLFEKIEKAHPEVHDFLSFILQNGSVGSGSEEGLRLGQCVVVLTSNLLTSDQVNRRRTASLPGYRKPAFYSLLRADIPREILDAVDEVVVLRNLGPGDFRELLRRRLWKAIQDLEKRGILLENLEDPLLDSLLKRLGNSGTGAAAIERLVETAFIRPLSLALLRYEGPFPVRLDLRREWLNPRAVPLLYGQDFVKQCRCGRCPPVLKE